MIGHEREESWNPLDGIAGQTQVLENSGAVHQHNYKTVRICIDHWVNFSFYFLSKKNNTVFVSEIRQTDHLTDVRNPRVLELHYYIILQYKRDFVCLVRQSAVHCRRGGKNFLVYVLFCALKFGDRFIEIGV